MLCGSVGALETIHDRTHGRDAAQRLARSLMLRFLVHRYVASSKDVVEVQMLSGQNEGKSKF